jgi:hypothetical protein
MPKTKTQRSSKARKSGKRSYATWARQGISSFRRNYASPLASFQTNRLLFDAVVWLDIATNQPVVNNNTGTLGWFNPSAAVGDVGNGPIQTAQWGGSIQINGLSDLFNPTNFQNLFNEYQITRCEIAISLQNGNSAGAGAGGGQAAPIPYLYWCEDPNDAGVPAGAGTVMEFGNVQHRLLTNDRPITISFVPKAAQVVYSSPLGGLAYGYHANNKAIWLDTANPSFACPHYGIKFWFKDFGASNSGVQIRIQPRLFFSCRRTN